MSDGTTTTRHEPMVMERFTLVPGGGRADYREETVCVSCWIGCDDETCTEPHGNAPWPCEVARLRERVAALEAACYEEEVEGGPRSFSGFFCRLCGWDCSPDFKAEHEPSCVLYEADAALAQAGDGGAA